MKLGPKNPTPKNRRSENVEQEYSNRAETVRSRRAQRSKERVSAASSRVFNPPPSRPVVVRGNSFGKPIHQQAGTRARRQFYVTMDRAAGTELRLPAIPMLHPGWRLASGFLAILMIVGIVSLWSSPFCMVGAVEVTGLQRLSADDINAALKLENLSIIEVDPGKILEKLTSTYPELINIRVGVEMPNVVSVHAEERVPVLTLLVHEETKWVDASGYIYPARGDAVGSDGQPLVTIQAQDGLPLVITLPDENSTSQPEAGVARADSPTPATTPAAPKPQIVDPVVLTALQELSNELPADTQLVYSKEHGLGWQAPEGWQVFIGTSLGNFEAKYSMYQEVIKYLAAEGTNPVLVSVEHLNAPYYRLEQ